MLRQIQELEMCSPSVAAQQLSANKQALEKIESPNITTGLLTPAKDNAHPTKHTVDSIIGSNTNGANLNESNGNSWQDATAHPQRNCLDNLLELLKKSQQQQKQTMKSELPENEEERSAQKRNAELEENSKSEVPAEKTLDVTPRRHSDFQPKRIKIESEVGKEEKPDVDQMKAPLVMVKESSKPLQELHSAPEPPQQTQLKKTPKRQLKVKGEIHFWPDESKEAKKLNEQVFEINLCILYTNN